MAGFAMWSALATQAATQAARSAYTANQRYQATIYALAQAERPEERYFLIPSPVTSGIQLDAAQFAGATPMSLLNQADDPADRQLIRATLIVHAEFTNEASRGFALFDAEQFTKARVWRDSSFEPLYAAVTHPLERRATSEQAIITANSRRSTTFNMRSRRRRPSSLRLGWG
jgi:hypothetical protein